MAAFLLPRGDKKGVGPNETPPQAHPGMPPATAASIPKVLALWQTLSRRVRFSRRRQHARVLLEIAGRRGAIDRMLPQRGCRASRCL